ncbi:hypothetical protein YC2023_000750 [Brassica napus]
MFTKPKIIKNIQVIGGDWLDCKNSKRPGKRKRHEKDAIVYGKNIGLGFKTQRDATEGTILIVSYLVLKLDLDSFSICFVGTYSTSVQPQAPIVLDPPGFIKSVVR